MKTLTFYAEDKLKLGVKTGQGILDVDKALSKIPAADAVPTSVEELLQGGASALASLEGYVRLVLDRNDATLFHAEESLKLGPCVTKPEKIICVGLNYRKHAEESNMPIPETPILFNKFNNTLAAHEEDVLLPHNSTQVDYEAELVIVIGKKAKQVSKADALEYVYGYCNADDLSARDLQFRTHQWLLGKSCDGFSPLGPYLVSADEIGDPNDLGIRCYVNGELRQDSNTSDMIFHCDEIVSYISDHMTLEPGDIILTGTPAGVVLGYPEAERVWLKDGDVVTVEIEGLGTLTNRMRGA